MPLFTDCLLCFFFFRFDSLLVDSPDFAYARCSSSPYSYSPTPPPLIAHRLSNLTTPPMLANLTPSPLTDSGSPTRLPPFRLVTLHLLRPRSDSLYLTNSCSPLASQIKEFHSYCGGLPSPESSSNPLGYKFSWSSRGVLLALLNSASYISQSSVVSVPGQQLMSHAQPYYISPAFNFIAYPNRDSTPYREWYHLDGEGEGETVVRGTLRYKGFETFVGCLVGLGWLDGEGREWLGKAKEEEWSWARVFKEVLGAKGESERCVAFLSSSLPSNANITGIVAS